MVPTRRTPRRNCHRDSTDDSRGSVGVCGGCAADGDGSSAIGNAVACDDDYGWCWLSYRGICG